MKISYLMREGGEDVGAHRSVTAVLVKQLLCISDHCWIQRYSGTSILVTSRGFLAVVVIVLIKSMRGIPPKLRVALL